MYNLGDRLTWNPTMILRNSETPPPAPPVQARRGARVFLDDGYTINFY
ncbi:hypothetical protein NSP_9790 [Nodularia spumigena CCY9414]|nr:hypothetical protein NSP_9790 [Nodularia spumigena CCY9414]